VKTLREILRLRPRGQHRRHCPCADIPTTTTHPGQKWTCPDCGQAYVSEILRDQNGRYVRWLLK
jgi:predicted RNA-binding Zn-ribbon protein involved in translation (DUF1610 family)